MKKTKEFRSEGKDGKCVSKRLRMNSLEEGEWVVQDLRLPILPNVTVNRSLKKWKELTTLILRWW